MSSESRVDRIAGRFAGNSAVLLLSYGFNTVVAAVVGVLLVRYLGREQYGLLSTTYAYTSFFLIFTSIGVDTIVQRDVARAPERADEIVGGAIGLRLILSLSSMVAAWVMLPILHPTTRLTFLVFLGTLAFPFSFQGLYLVLYAVELRQGLPKLVMAGWSVVLSLVKLAFIALRMPLEAFVALEAVSGVVVFILSLFLGRRAGLAARMRWDPKEWRHLLRESWPVAVASTFIQVYLRVDQLMLFRMVGAGEVGAYAVPVRVVEFGNVIPTIFMISAFPLLARLREESAERLERATHLSFRAMALVAVPLAAYLFLYAQPILRAVFGTEFATSAPILRILTWSLPFAFANSVLYNRLFATGNQRTAAVLASVAAAVNVALNAVLIPRLGGVGAAEATVVAYALVVPAALLAQPSRLVGLLGVRGWLKPALATLVALLAVRGWGLGMLWGTGLFLLLYAAVLVAVGEVGAKEVALVRRAMGRER